MELTQEQKNAVHEAEQWLREGKRQIFRIFGYAGTGKTTIALRIAECAGGNVVFGAYTGKAALVMQSKGCAGASTIHSMIYRAMPTADGGVHFVRNDFGPAAAARLIIIDECSMVGEKLGKDLVSFGKPILVLGDLMQLRPVDGAGFFTAAQPDVMLTEIRRQAKDSFVLNLAIAAITKFPLSPVSHEGSQVIRARDLEPKAVLTADQVLVGTNDTRRQFNRRIRELIGRRDPMPSVGDKLVCLRNNHRKGLLNGSLWTVKRLRPSSDELLRMDVAEIGTDWTQTIAVHPSFFDGSDDDAGKRRQGDAFSYGSVLTVHKAQGSQWDNVVLFDESKAFPEADRARLLYTGITRAAKRITIVMP